MVKLNQSIDEKFLEENTRIKNALYLADIHTYSDLFEKANQKYNLYYIPRLGISSIKKLNQHVIGKFKRSMPDYKRNINF